MKRIQRLVLIFPFHDDNEHDGPSSDLQRPTNKTRSLSSSHDPHPPGPFHSTTSTTRSHTQSRVSPTCFLYLSFLYAQTYVSGAFFEVIGAAARLFGVAPVEVIAGWFNGGVREDGDAGWAGER
jgi:hypothetical protein